MVEVGVGWDWVLLFIWEVDNIIKYNFLIINYVLFIYIYIYYELGRLSYNLLFANLNNTTIIQ